MESFKMKSRAISVGLFSLILPFVMQGWLDRPSIFAHEPMKRQDGEEEEAAKKIIQEATKTIDESRERDWDAFENRADAFMTLGEFDKAFSDYSKAIDLMSDEGHSISLLLQARMGAAIRKEDYRQALADAEILAKDFPPSAYWHGHLAMILARSPDEKVMNATRALEVAEYAELILKKRRGAIEFSEVQFALAAAHSVNGNFAKAVTHQERAIEALTAGGFRVSEGAKLGLKAYKNGKTFPFSAEQAKESR